MTNTDRNRPVRPGARVVAAIGQQPQAAAENPEVTVADALAKRPIGPLTLLSASAPFAASIDRPMDPRLMRFLTRRRLGRSKPAASSAGVDEVSVIAKVRDRNEWESISEVRCGDALQMSDGTWLATARIPIARIEQVRRNPTVVSLKAAKPVKASLSATIRDMSAAPAQSPAGTKPKGGAGVVVGIVDFGCDFAHRNFITENGKSRLLCIWDQTAAANANSPQPWGYGRLISNAEINAALKKSNPYKALGYEPEADAHGTHVMDIAAGNGSGSGVAGVAPAADIVFVQLSSSDVAWSGVQVTDTSFGDSVQLLEAVRFIFAQAGNRPCVVNLSLGTNGGPHDGTTLVEEWFDNLCKEAPNRAVVIAASNSYADGIHAAGQVAQNTDVDLLWQTTAGDQTGNEMDIWYSGPDRISVEVLGPDGSRAVLVAPGSHEGLYGDDGDVKLYVVNRLADPNNGDNEINVYMSRELSGGQWTVRLRGEQIMATGAFHAWIERDDNGPTAFGGPLDNAMTIGSISCGFETIAVGSFDAHKTSKPISYFSSEGPTRDGRQKPEISAPGHDVMAAKSRSVTGVVRMSGTSMAAPAVTGAIALGFAEAARRNLALSSAQLRQCVQAAAQRNPPINQAWDPRYGWGRLSAAGLMREIANLGGAPAAAANPGGQTAKSAKKTGGAARKQPLATAAVKAPKTGKKAKKTVKVYKGKSAEKPRGKAGRKAGKEV